MSEPTSRVLRDVRDELAATECGHEPYEGTGSAIECICGWPTRADFDARDPGTWVPDYNIHLLDALVAAAERAEL